MNEPADRKKIIMRRKKVFEAIDVKTMLILKTNKKFMWHFDTEVLQVTHYKMK